MGRAKITRTIHTLELSEELEARLEGLEEKLIPAVASKALSNLPIADMAVLGIGFWFGYEMNYGIPGGRILENVGLPDRRDEVIAASKHKKIMEQTWQNQITSLDVHRTEGRDHMDAEAFKIIEADILSDIKEAKENFRDAEQDWKRERKAQGMILAAWFLFLKYGILSGIGEIIPF